MLSGERTPTATWCVRALLLAALLLGLVTMHTLGHTASEPAPPTAAHLSHGPASGPGTASGTDTGDAPAPAHHHMMPPPAHDDGHGHGTAGDPLSVCLAVLGIWTAAALLGAAVRPALRGRGTALSPFRSRTLRALWPLPPPRTALRLAQLSILRT
ncbi:DUF6153 family protein [Streptomyces sp. 891-h]|uniref:DUF6153 family protein n=1 Tax=unclassified Streptomyces TaxID=2593676 RepID=UPI001FAA0523|nr:DUF6153 family protein [Streptomyces sp. 891-h]UNZ19625.1 hypothetical protein HC362_23905 [Streptomyces sp. 891-h]